MKAMNSHLKAEVKNGRLVMDEPTNLPEGTVLELAPADPFEVLTDQERERLNASIDRGLEQAREGKARPVDDFLADL